MSVQSKRRDESFEFLAGGGEMGARMRAHPWSGSPLGPLRGWPQSLRTAVSIMLNSRHPMFLAWGPQLAFLYNDGYIPIFGAKHPHTLGKPFAAVWAEIWPDLRPLVERALAGEATWSEDLHLVMERNGYPEDTWYTFSYSAVRDESGGVGGMFCACTETTGKVLAERRLRFQLDFSEQLRELNDPVEVTVVAAALLGKQLQAARVGYGEIDAAGREIRVERDWTRPGIASLAGEVRLLDSFGPAIIDELRAGRTVRIDDIAADERAAPYVAGYDSVATRAMIVLPLLREGVLTAVLYVHEPQGRNWWDAEVAIAEDAAQRTWSAVERARADQKRRVAQGALARQLGAETRRLRQLFEQAPSFIAVMSGPQHVFEMANAAFMRLVGDRDIVGKPVREALPEVAGQGFFEKLDRVYRTGEPFSSIEARILLRRAEAASEERFVDFIYQPVTGPDGSVVGIFIDGYDVTERRRASDALRESEGRLRLAMQAGRMAEVTFHLDSERVEHSASYARLLGFDGQRPLTLADIRERYHPDDRERAIRKGAEILAGDNFYDVEHRVIWTDGTVRWLYGRGEVARNAAGRAVSVTAVYIDVTEQKRIEAALRESEAQFRTFAQAMPNHVWAARANGELDWFNDTVYAFTGLPPGALHGNGWRKIMHPDDVQRATQAWLAALEAGSLYEAEARIRRADGIYRWFIVRALPIRDASGQIVRWVGTDTDIEDQKASAAELSRLNATLESRVEQRSRELRAAEDALRHAQKMEAVGQLTGGIAHDFNNILTGIIGSLDIVRRRLASGRVNDVDRFIDAAVTSSNRAAGLTHRLLAFSRRQSLDARPIEINRLIQSMEELLRRTLGENIALLCRLHDGLWLAEADANQLESALLNLVINARDAMPDGGQLVVETSNTQLDAGYTAQREGLEPGDYVVMCVSDTGVGMSQSVLERAFDPFFTTKPIGQGTGLGLSMIYGFARQSRGHVRIDSEVGQGTTVKLYLPRFTGEPLQGDDRSLLEAPRALAGETVLIVEDDAAVRMLVAEVLRELGYAYLEAIDADGALLILQSTQRIDLLISDVGLPGMNGRQLADVARRHRPDLRVLFITGYAEGAVVRGGFLDAGMEMITKPFALDALAGKVRELLGK